MQAHFLHAQIRHQGRGLRPVSFPTSLARAGRGRAGRWRPPAAPGQGRPRAAPSAALGAAARRLSRRPWGSRRPVAGRRRRVARRVARSAAATPCPACAVSALPRRQRPRHDVRACAHARAHGRTCARAPAHTRSHAPRRARARTPAYAPARSACFYSLAARENLPFLETFSYNLFACLFHT